MGNFELCAIPADSIPAAQTPAQAPAALPAPPKIPIYKAILGARLTEAEIRMVNEAGRLPSNVIFRDDQIRPNFFPFNSLGATNTVPYGYKVVREDSLFGQPLYKFEKEKYSAQVSPRYDNAYGQSLK